MSTSKNRNNENVIDLRNNRTIDLTGQSQDSSEHDDTSSGLSRPSVAAVPPWRESHTTTILGPRADQASELPEVADELRSALFETAASDVQSDEQSRVLKARKLKLVAAKSDRALGKPNGTLFQRLKNRR